jgi:very-short-patch-repair endonuclease
MPSEFAKKLPPLARNLRQQDTWAERLLWSWLRDKRFSAYKFRRQHVFGPHILDFFCVEASLDIELDGSQHGHPEQRQKDKARDAWLAKAGVKVLRFWNARLRREKEVVRETIWRELQARAPRPLPDYCRPMGTVPASDSNITNTTTLTSPSPRPSPLGRGRTTRRLPQNPATGFAKGVSEQSQTVQSPSPLPKGEGQGEGERDLEKVRGFSPRRLS